MNISPDTLQRLSQHTCAQYGADLCCLRFQPEKTSAFCTVIQRRKNPPGPRPSEAAPQRLRFSACATTANYTGVPKSKAREHDAAREQWKNWQK